jgi:hypothetical protein
MVPKVASPSFEMMRTIVWSRSGCPRVDDSGLDAVAGFLLAIALAP